MQTPKIPKLKKLADLDQGTKNIIRPILIGVIGIVLVAFGLEVTNNDWDLGKLLNGEGFNQAKVMRDKSGNVVSSGGKFTDEYNCDDFETQAEAQKFFKNAGGPSQDTNRLDGDNDGEACEGLRAD